MRAMREFLNSISISASLQDVAAPAVPAELDYEMWTGPAPMRPWNGLQHPRRWRAFTEYGNGIMGDMCVHMLDMVRWMMDLGWPTRISSSGGILVDPASVAPPGAASTGGTATGRGTVPA